MDPRPDLARCHGLPRRTLLRAALLGAAGLALGGCASLNQVAVDVATFGAWPTARPAGSFAFERLPSQQREAAATAQQVLEDAAGAALEAVGFRRAAQPDAADVLVQVSQRQSRVLDPWFEFGAGRGFGRAGVGLGAGLGWRRPFGYGYGYRGWGPDPVYEQREVALVLSDRASRQVLFEGHARHDSRLVSDAVLRPLFDATLQDFPHLAAGERRVLVSLPPA